MEIKKEIAQQKHMENADPTNGMNIFTQADKIRPKQINLSKTNENNTAEHRRSVEEQKEVMSEIAKEDNREYMTQLADRLETNSFQ